VISEPTTTATHPSKEHVGLAPCTGKQVPKIEISRFDYAILIGLGGANLIKSQIREISNLINRQKQTEISI